MANVINLLPELSTEQKKKDVKVWYLNIIAVGSLMLVGLVLAALFAYKTIIQTQINDNLAKISQREESISAESEIVNLSTFIDSKIDKLTPKLPDGEKSQNFERVVALFPVGITVTAYIENEKDEFGMGGTTDNLAQIQELTNTLKQQGQEFFQDFYYKSIVKDEEGFYDFVILFTKKGSLKKSEPAAGALE